MCINKPFLILLFFTLFIAFQTNAQLFINEFMAVNNTVIQDPDYGGYVDWIELYNSNNDSVNLSGFSITDDPLDTTKWVFPEGTKIVPGGYLVIWADGLNQGMHASFKLSSAGESIYLFDSTKTFVDGLNFSLQQADVSFGRETDGSSQWVEFTSPTPGTPNSGVVRAQKASYSIESGFFDQAVNVTLSSSIPNATIRFTTDGSAPTETSDVYTQPIEITSTMVIRSKVFADGYISSHTATHSYFINESETNFKVVSIAVNPDDFFGDDYGIYVDGIGNGNWHWSVEKYVNWNTDWERRINVELFDDTKSAFINQEAGAQIFGGWTRHQAQKSLAIFARNEYGNDTFHGQIFEEKPNEKYKSFVLRTGGNDWMDCLFRDAFMQQLVKDDLDVDYLAYEPAIVYINGEYWGIHNIREKISEHYLADNYPQYDKDSVDVLAIEGTNEQNYTALSGSDNAFTEFWNVIKYNNMNDATAWDYVESHVDVDNFMDYIIAELYFGNMDWPANNHKLWRPQKEDGKFRWILYDLDYGYGLDNHHSRGISNFATSPWEIYSNKWIEWYMNADNSYFGEDIDWPCHPNATLYFRKMMENDGFRETFLQRYMYCINSIFEPTKSIALISQFKADYAPNIQRHADKWGGWYSTAYYDTSFASFDDWSTNVDQMIQFANLRPQYAKSNIEDYFNLNGSSELTITTYGADASCSIAGKSIAEKSFTGEFFNDIPATIVAQPKLGAVFKEWQTTDLANTTEIIIPKEDVWKYLDNGTDQSSTWTALNFDDAAWSQGNAKLGYGDDDNITTLSYGSDANNKHITYYFRKEFSLTDLSEIISLQAQLLRDDGAIVYLNGTEVIRTNLPDGNIDFHTMASDFVDDAHETTYYSFNLPLEQLMEGKNVIAVEIHQYSATSSDIGFDLELTANRASKNGTTLSTNAEISITLQNNMALTAVYETDATYQNLFVNEVMSKNDSYMLDNAGEYEDWIEIYNANDFPIDLAGFYLADSNTIWTIPDTQPDSTTISAHGYLVFYADNDTEQGVLHTNFKISSVGERIKLFKSDDVDTLLIHSLTCPAVVAPNISYGCIPDGSDVFEWFDTPTPGDTNEPNNLFTPITGIYINEVLASNSSGINDSYGELEDWIEIYNDNDFEVNIGGLYLSDTLGDLFLSQIPTTYPDSTTIPAKGFIILWADKDPEQGVLHLDFKLSSAGEVVTLTQYNGLEQHKVDEITFDGQPENISIGRYPDGSTDIQAFETTTPNASNIENDVFTAVTGLFVNEILTSNISDTTDNFGEFEDWIEIYNSNDYAVDIGGLYLSDTASTYFKHQIPKTFPDSTTIPAKGYIVLWADKDPEQGILHIDFKLNVNEGVVVKFAVGVRFMVIIKSSESTQLLASVIVTS
jgi:hypothetical protein